MTSAVSSITCSLTDQRGWRQRTASRVQSLLTATKLCSSGSGRTAVRSIRKGVVRSYFRNSNEPHVSDNSTLKMNKICSRIRDYVGSPFLASRKLGFTISQNIPTSSSRSLRYRITATSMKGFVHVSPYAN